MSTTVLARSTAESIKSKGYVKWITLTAIFMAMNIAVSSFGIPVPGGHLYLCDTIICTAALLLDPLSAFIVGGVGSFLGDMIFYPAPMFVSLVTHGIQALVISAIVHSGIVKNYKHRIRVSIVATLIGGVIMVVGYTLGKTFVYSTFEAAILKLPYEIAQALLGVVGSILLTYKAGLYKIFSKMENN